MSLRDKSIVESPCFERAEGISALQVALDNGEIYILPYIHFQFAHLDRSSGDDVLQIHFSTHSVNVVGTRLRDPLLALQKQSLSLIKTTSGGNQSRGILIRTISILDFRDSEALPDKSLEL